MRKTAALCVLCLLGMALPARAGEGEKGQARDEAKKPPSTTVIQSEDGRVKITVSAEGREPAVLKAARVEVRAVADKDKKGQEGRKEPEEPKEDQEPWKGQKVIRRLGPSVRLDKVMSQDKSEAKSAKVEVQVGAPGGGWLGIRVTPVPAAVAAQLGLKDQGVMVRNLVKGSPADKAGLDRYDVIVEVGKGEPAGNVEQFIRRVKSHKPGQKVELTVIHEGGRKALTVVLGKPPAGEQEVRYVYEEDPDDQWLDELKLHRGMLRKGPDGWTFHGPGGPIELPRDVLKALPKQPWGNVQVIVGATGGPKKHFKLTRTVDGKTIEVESADDGSILVRRRQAGADGEPVTKKYKDREELRQKDPEAYELVKGVYFPGWGIDLKSFPMPTPRSWMPATQAARDAAEAVKKLHRELEEQLRQWGEKARDEADAARRKIARALDDEPAQPARYQFDVDEKGRIRAEVREGDSAAKLTFASEEEMKQKAPKLHEQYQKLLKGGK